MLQTAKHQDIQPIQNLSKRRKKGNKMTKKLRNDSSEDKKRTETKENMWWNEIKTEEKKFTHKFQKGC